MVTEQEPTSLEQSVLLTPHACQSVPTAYKPSPLGYGSPPARSSPFRRAESPASPSPLRYTTPTSSPTKAQPTHGTPSRFAPEPRTPTSPRDTRTRDREQTPSRDGVHSQLLPSTMRTSAARPALGSGNALSQLQPAQVSTLRDGFQILDRDCDGVVNRDDVADMLNQLGRSTRAFDLRSHC